MNKRSIKKLEKRVNVSMPKEIKLSFDINWVSPDGSIEKEVKEIMFYPKPKYAR